MQKEKNKKLLIALENAAKKLKKSPNNIEIYIARALVYEKLEMYKEAFTDYETVINLDKNNRTAYFYRAHLYHEIKNYEAALGDYNVVILLNPDLESYLERGVNYAKLELYDLAIKDFDSAIALDKKSSIAYYNRAVAKHSKNDNQSAEEDFKIAIRLNPKFPIAYANLAIVQFDNSDIDNAFKNINKAIKLDPNDYSFYAERSKMLSYLGDFDEALNDCNRALELAPTIPILYQIRGTLYDNFLFFDEALKDINKAIKLDPDDAAFYYGRGIVRANKGQHEKAIDDYNKAVKLDTNFSSAYVNRAASYLKIGSYRAAIDSCNQAIKIEPSAPAYEFIAEANYYLGDNKKAEKNYRKSVLLQIKNCIKPLPEKISLCIYRPINDNTIKSLKEHYIWFSHPNDFNDPLDSKFYRDTLKRDILLKISEDIRIRSLSYCDTLCNTLLWSHYAKNHKGIIIEYEFDVETLINMGIYLCNVEYSDYIKPPNKILWADEFGKCFFTKAKAWSYENEWRMVTLKDNLTKKNKLTKGFRIKSITFGLKSVEKDIEVIKSTLPKCRYYKMIQEDKYKKPFTLVKDTLSNYYSNKTFGCFEKLHYSRSLSLMERLNNKKKREND